MTDLSVNLAGVTLKNPIVVASGTYGFGHEFAEFYDLSELGAICAKGLTVHKKDGNPPPRIAETPAGILNSVGLQNPGVDAFCEQEMPYLKKSGTKIIANISGENMAKGLICGFLGILTATVGIDSVTSYIRFTDNANLLSGIQYIPVMIGLFAMSQAFETIEDIYSTDEIDASVTRLLPTKEDVKTILRVAPVTGLIRTMIGIIPGAGADIGSFVGYNTARGMSKHPELFGKGSPEAVAASEGGNNGVTGGAMIPMLTLGVPGDAVAAIMIGALTIQGLTPGPMLFKTNKVLVYTIFLGMFVANTIMVLLGFSCIRLFTKVLSVPKTILTPIIFILCVVGSYAMRSNFYDVGTMLIAGVIGWLMGKVKIPTSPAILGLILGPMAEKNFRTALLKSSGNPVVFFNTLLLVSIPFLP